MTTSDIVEKRPGSFPVAFFSLTFLFSWLLWLFPSLTGKGWISLSPSIELVFVIAGACGPLVSVFALLFHDGGVKATFQFAKRSLRYRIPFRYLLTILFLFPVLGLLAAFLHSLAGGPPATLQISPKEIPTAFLFLFFLGGSVQEEFGWAYAIDRLQQKWPPLRASIVLGVIWGLWHLPLFFISLPEPGARQRMILFLIY
jgi:membrane protease YdiL (CAAX protease family)